MTFPHSCPVDDADAYTEGEPWVRGSVKKIAVTQERVALRVLAMPTRRGAVVVVASTRLVLGHTLTKWRALLGSAVPVGTPQHAAWKSPAGISTQIQACSQQLHDNQSFLGFLKTAFVDSCYATWARHRSICPE